MKQGKMTRKEHATRLVKEPGKKKSLRNICRSLEGDNKVDFKGKMYEHVGQTSNQPFTL
jgi:hypothetical protein